ncbi:hypothetical protein D3C85_252670 [compost metagenome]
MAGGGTLYKKRAQELFIFTISLLFFKKTEVIPWVCKEKQEIEEKLIIGEIKSVISYVKTFQK